MVKVIGLIHIYNEEYLLPFWLSYHKDIFDYGIIIDYSSTDNSIDICKKICPHWKIITSRNTEFASWKIDEEVQDIENSIEEESFKLVLNITEYVVPYEKPLKEILEAYKNKKQALQLMIYGAFSNEYHPETISDFFHYLLNENVKYHYDGKFLNFRGHRYIHNYDKNDNNGKIYGPGRHIMQPELKYIMSDEICILYLGFYPMNEKLLERKLQIKHKMPDCDKDHGVGYQHLWSREQMLQINNDYLNTGKSLQFANIKLYNYLQKTFVGKNSM